MTKRIISALTAFMLCFGAAGCSDAGEETESVPVRTTAADSVPSEDGGGEQAYDDSSDNGGDASAKAADIGAEDAGSPEEGARMAYSAVQVYLFDADVLGDADAIKELMSERAPAATSAEGLDIGAEEPSAEGDKVIYSTMRYAGFAEGVITVGVNDTGDGRLFVQFTLPDGSLQRYPEM